MKKLFSLILVLGFLVSCSPSDNDEVPTSTELVGEWEAVKECYDGNCFLLDGEGIGITYDYIRFDSNGTFTEVRDGDENNVLSYTVNGDYFTTNEGGYKTKYIIIKITNNVLEFDEVWDSENGDYSEDEIHNYYFKR